MLRKIIQIEGQSRKAFDYWQLNIIDSRRREKTAHQNSATMSSRFEDLEARNADLKRALAAEVSSHKELQAKVGNLERRQLDHSIELGDQAKQILDLERALNPLTKACNDLRYRVRDAEATNALLQTRIDTLKSEKRRLDRKLTAHDECHRTLCEPFANRGRYPSLMAARVLRQRLLNLQSENEDLQESLDAEMSRRRRLQAEKVRVNETNAALKKEVRKIKAQDGVREQAHWEDLCFDRLFEQGLREDLTLTQRILAIIDLEYS